jgi:DHA2 family multidrug resistance protein
MLNLQMGYWHIFWPQIIQGAGLSLLVVPLTTVSMDKIPREKMGNATSLFNLMRNLGGSIGIAVTGTMIARQTRVVTGTLGEHVNIYDYGTQQMFLRLRGGFMAAGADAVTATNRAYAAMFGMIARQAAMVSFVGLFQLLGIIFLLLIPLVLLMKRPGHSGPVVGAH